MPTPTELRSAVEGLNVLASRDLRSLWRQVSTAVQAQEALSDLLPLLVRTYGIAAATVAADWYDELRDDLNIDRRFSAIVADVGDSGAEALAGWGVGPLFAETPDWKAAQVLVEGGLQRRIANAARESIRTSAIEDPSARGWQRSASGGCSFCQMLASRGAVFTRSSADFASHDHCRCVAVPAFRGHPRLVKSYTPSQRVINDADRARVRAYLAKHHAG